MFNHSFSIDFSAGDSRNGNLYSKLETGVIAAFNPEGRIKPLYFQYKDSYGDNNNVKIESVLTFKDDHYAGLPVIVYSCMAIVQNKRLPCNLRYHIAEHYWELLY
ncbi:MAG: hypothetical protein WCD89_25625 [Anaerocolumna sp.]